MDPNPLTIVVPVLNEAKRTSDLVDHLNALNCDVVIVDGGSTDGTYETLSAGAGSRIRVLQATQGRARQMNAGAAGAGTPFLLFLHADTLLPDNAVSLVEAALAGDKSPWGRFDVGFDAATPTLNMVAWFMNWRSALSGICTGDQAIFTTASAFAAIGGFKEMPLMEDIELSKSLKRMGRPIRLRSRVVTAARRWQRDGPLRTIACMWWLRFRYWLGASPEALARSYTHAR